MRRRTTRRTLVPADSRLIVTEWNVRRVLLRTLHLARQELTQQIHKSPLHVFWPSPPSASYHLHEPASTCPASCDTVYKRQGLFGPNAGIRPHVEIMGAYRNHCIPRWSAMRCLPNLFQIRCQCWGPAGGSEAPQHMSKQATLHKEHASSL
jgi:hypothetical protein